MIKEQKTKELDMKTAHKPFLYEIRIQGRLSNERWTSWFEDVSVSTAKGESTLRGRVPDHAALYGLLGRLRDLAVPLVAVRVLDSEAQRTLRRQSRRYDLVINLLLVLAYLTLTGALSALTIWVTPVINTALALTLLFATLGASAHALWLWSGRAPWRWIAYGAWVGSAATFLVFIPVSGLLSTALSLAIVLLICTGGLLYTIYSLRHRAEEIDGNLFDAGPTSSRARRDAVDAEQSGDLER